ncbi:MAG TPA: hypothetical protein VFS40_06065 [Gemmatimonadales bacterium]|nr:hypothetical protein [Gemmatimonadales bacterium]
MQPPVHSSAPASKLRGPGARGERAARRAAGARPSLFVLGLLLGLGACRGEPPATALRTLPRPDASGRLLVAEVGFAAPQAALYDSAQDVYFVSNANGDPAARDANGFISRVGPDGAVRDLKWIAGSRDMPLHAPRGMALKGDTLVVADVGVVRMFDRTTGAPLQSRVVPGHALADVAVAPDGTVFVSDLGAVVPTDAPAPAPTAHAAVPRPASTGVRRAGAADAASRDSLEPATIYRLGRYDAFPIARGTHLERPSGIVADRSGVIVAPFGGRTIYRIGRGGARTPLATLPQGRLDGLLRLSDGDLVVTSWDAQAVYRVRPGGGPAETVVRGVATPAQPGLDTRRGRLLLPLPGREALLIVPLRH